jgi:serine phosphatase RsbU (regulator of sigma subunit)
MLSIEIAIAKTHKYAMRDSGDTAETVERPTGGLSVVLIDGQGSGAAAKSLSMLVSSKVVGLLKEGVRDGAVARGAHDSLHAYRHGKVSATLDIVSVDLATSTLVVTRNSPVPYIVRSAGAYRLITSESSPIGLYRHTRPSIEQLPIEEGVTVIVFSDGIASAGARHDRPFDPLAWVEQHAPEHALAHDIADGMLATAVELDKGRPSDDMTVIATTITASAQEQPVRTLRVSLPFARRGS